MRILMLIFQLFVSVGIYAQTAEIYFLRSMIASDKGDDTKALELMDQAIQLDSLNGDYFFYRAFMKSGLGSINPIMAHFEDSTYNAAIGDINYARILKGYNSLQYVNLEARIQLKFGKFKEVEKTLEKGFDPNAESSSLANFYIIKSRLRRKNNEIDAALENLEKALEVDSSSLMILNGVAYQYAELGIDDKALKLFNKVLAENPDDRTAWMNIAFYSLQRGRYQKTVNLYSDIIKKDSVVGLAFNNRGEAYYHLKDYKKALEDVNKALELGPGNAYAYKNRALIYLALGQKEAACDDLFVAKKLKYSHLYDNLVINLLIDNCLKTNQKVKVDSSSTHH